MILLTRLAWQGVAGSARIQKVTSSLKVNNSNLGGKMLKNFLVSIGKEQEFHPTCNHWCIFKFFVEFRLITVSSIIVARG